MRRSLTIKYSLVLAAALLVNLTAVAGPPLQRVFFQFDASNGLADNSAQTISCTKTGRMVITTIGHINFYDGGAFSHIDPTADNVFPLPKYNGHYHQYFDKQHHLWLKDKRSVTCLDLLTERFIVNVDSVIKGMGMNHPVDDMFGDVDNHLWFMSGRKLYGLDLGKEFPVPLDYELQDVDVYQGKLLLQFFANGVVSAYDIESGRHLYDSPAFGPEEQGRYDRSSVLLPDSNYYYQIRNGEKEAVLLRFDASTRQWKQMMALPYHLNNMVKERGKLYIASEYGYWKLDVRTGDTEHEETLTLTRGRKLMTDINVICFDRLGGMWMGTEKRGLLYSRRYKFPFVSYTWDQPEAQTYGRMIYEYQQQHPLDLPRHVNCKYRDSRGWTWTGSYTGLLLERPGHPNKTFTRRDGLLNEMIRSVIEDDSHDMWISTSYGISHLFIAGDSVCHIETYNSVDGVPRESFASAAAIKLGDGTIVMQSLDHVVAFHPSNFYTKELSEMVLYPKLIRLMVNGRFMEPGMALDGKVILNRSATRIREVSVNYNQNTLSLTFSGLNYERPIQTYYRVRVHGVKDYENWRVLSHANSEGLVDGQGLLHLPLTALRPGRYQIELQASMVPDHWPQEPFVWVVNVKQPWWRSTGIYLLLAVVVLSLFAVNFWYYTRITRLRFLRNNQEDDLMRRIRSYAERAASLARDWDIDLSPSETERLEDSVESNTESSHLFDKAMVQIVPYLHEHRGQHVSMQQLSALTGIPVMKLYDVLSANLYKSPRQIAEKLRNSMPR